MIYVKVEFKESMLNITRDFYQNPMSSLFRISNYLLYYLNQIIKCRVICLILFPKWKVRGSPSPYGPTELDWWGNASLSCSCGLPKPRGNKSHESGQEYLER